MQGLESFFTVSEQMKLFLLSCLFGFPIGIVYDVFRAVRIIFPSGKIAAAIEDILFFIIYAVFLMCFTVSCARSEFRIYFCVGNLIGFIIYFFTVGNITIRIINKTAASVKKGLYLVLRPINNKIVLLFKKCGAFFVGSFQKVKISKKNSKTP